MDLFRTGKSRHTHTHIEAPRVRTTHRRRHRRSEPTLLKDTKASSSSSDTSRNEFLSATTTSSLEVLISSDVDNADFTNLGSTTQVPPRGYQMAQRPPSPCKYSYHMHSDVNSNILSDDEAKNYELLLRLGEDYEATRDQKPKPQSKVSVPQDYETHTSLPQWSTKTQSIPNHYNYTSKSNMVSEPWKQVLTKTIGLSPIHI